MATTKSRVTGLSVGEIQGSIKEKEKAKAKLPVIVQKPATPTIGKAVKPVYQSINGKIVDINSIPKQEVKKSFTEGGADDPAVINGSRPLTAPTPNAAKGEVQLEYDEMKKNAEDLGIGDKVYSSFDEQVKSTIQRQRELKAAQEAQLAEAEAANKYNTKTQKTAIQTGANVSANAIRGSREGIFSQSNIVTGEKIQQTANAQITRLEQQAAAAQVQIDDARKGLAQAELQGNTEAAQHYTNVLAAAQSRIDTANANKAALERQGVADAVTLLNTLSSNGGLSGLSDQQIQDLQSELVGVSPTISKLLIDSAIKQGVTSEAKEKYDQSITAIDTLGKVFNSGSKMSPEQVMSFAGALDLSQDIAMGLYQSYEATRNDKSLTEEQMRIQNMDALEIAKQKQRGEFTQASQNLAFLQKMYEEGYPQEAIDAFKRAAGLNDPTQDPLYMAQAALEAANARIAEKHANGIPVTPQDMIDLAAAQKELSKVDPNADPWSDAVIPNNPLDGFSVTFEDGALQVTTKPGAKYQCGAGVNRAWGLSYGTGADGNGGMPSEISGKKELVDKNGYTTDSLEGDYSKIVPGMAFVMETFDALSKPYGHTGLVKTTPDKNGDFTTEEWNADGKSETHTIKTRNVRDMYGFALPPEGTYTNVNGGDKGSLSDAISLGYLTEDQQKMYRSMKSRGETVPSLLKEEDEPTFTPEAYKDDPIGKNYASAFSVIKFKNNDDKVAASEVMKSYIDAGDYVGAKEQLEGYALNSASPKQQEVMSGKANIISTMEQIQKDIDKFVAEGGDLNIFTGLVEDTYQQFGLTSDPKLSVLANDIAMALFEYRKNLTGAVFTEQESRQYEKQYPSIGKTPELNKTKIDSIIKAAKQQQDSFYGGKLGATKYKAVKEAAEGQEKSAATPAEIPWQQQLGSMLSGEKKKTNNPWDLVDDETEEDIISNVK